MSPQYLVRIFDYKPDRPWIVAGTDEVVEEAPTGAEAQQAVQARIDPARVAKVAGRVGGHDGADRPPA